MRRLYMVLVGMALLSGCKNSVTASEPTVSTNSIETEAPAAKGDKGDTGSQGDTGPAGPQGVQGQAAPVFRLKDMDGNLIPGTLIGQGLLYSEDEDKTATYGCDIDGHCGLKTIPALYQSTNCTGSPFVYTTNLNTVFVAHGQRFYVGVEHGLYNGLDFYSYSDGSQCQGGTHTVHSAYIGVPYSGAFPLAPNGPYQVVKQ